MAALGSHSRTPVGRRARIVVALTCVAVLGAACGSDDDDTATGPSASGTGVAGGVFRVPIGEPAAIDPYNTRESEGNTVSKTLFVGLVALDESKGLALQPAVATEWATNDDCTQWNFKLRQSQFSNGEAVTAESFIRGWTRTATRGVGVPGRLPPVRSRGVRRAPRRLGHHLLRAVGPRPPDARGEPQRGRLRVRQAHAC